MRSWGITSGGIILTGGELLTTANFTSARSVSLNPVSLGVTPSLAMLMAPNILAAAANTTATYTGVVFGTGGLTIGDGSQSWHGGAVQRGQHLLWRYDGRRRPR